MKRRSQAEIAAVAELHAKTDAVARNIMARVDPEDTLPLSVSAAAYWHNKAAYQQEVADTLVVKFTTKDPAEAERVARAVAQALREGGGR